MKTQPLLIGGEVVPFTCAGGALGAPGAPTTKPVKAGQLYEVRCTATVRIVQGNRTVVAVEDIEVQPAAPLRFRAKSGQYTVAASTSATTYAWLIPVDE